MNVAVSYTRKLNHALYGGNNFESSDFFVSLNMEIDDETDPKGIYEDLHTTCKEMVNESVEKEILDISGGLSKLEWDKWLVDVVHHRRWGDVETYNRMSPYQRNIAQMLKRAVKRGDYQEEKTIT